MTDDLQTDEVQAGEPRTDDGTRFNGALLGFYISCTVVGIAVTIAAAALIVFRDWSFSTPVAVVSILVTLLASISCWWTLHVARGRV